MTRPNSTWEQGAKARSWAVIGAGVIGLAAARRLSEAGASVTVYDSDAIVGGQAAGFELEPGVWLERFYHHVFRSDHTLRRSFDEMGLANGLEWQRPLTATLIGGDIERLDSAMSLLRFRHLPVADRVRMGASLAFLRALPSPGVLEGRAAGPWLRRWMGRGSYERIWRPLFEGKFGPAADEVALPWFWARVHDRSSVLGYPRGGFQPFLEALADRTRKAGGSCVLNTTVESLERDAGGFLVRARSAEGAPIQTRHDAVISTLSPAATAGLAPELPASWREKFTATPNLTALSVILSLDRPLTGTYWLNVNDAGFPFVVVVEHTAMRSPAEYGGRHLVYLGNYRDPGDPVLKLGKQELVDLFAVCLARLNPAFDPSWIKASWSFSAPDTQPVADRGFRHRIPPFETPLPGLYTATISQTYPHDRGQSRAIELGERLTRRILGS